MKLYIYRLEGCKTCMRRQDQHNELAGYMAQLDVEVVGVLFGMVNGERVEPLPEHDQLCRKEDDQMKYQAPVYILDADEAVIKLPDMGNYQSTQQYAEAIVDIVDGAMGDQDNGGYNDEEGQ